MATSALAFTTPEPRPAVWDTTTEWPMRVRLGNHAVHAAANLPMGRRLYPWTACGRPAGDHQTPMPKGWPVNCRGCRQALAALAEAAAR